MKKRKRDYPSSGGKWETPARKGFKFACCDCCLVHTIDHRLVKDWVGRTRIQWYVERDNRATGQLRRWRKVRVREIEE